MKKYLLYIGLPLGLLGVFAYFKTQSKLLYEATYSIGNVEIMSIKDGVYSLRVTLGITNKSAIDFILKKYDLAIFVNNSNRIAQIRQSDIDTLIKGGGQTSYFSFDFDFNAKEFNLTDTITNLLSTGRQTLINFNGTAEVSKGILTFDIPFRLTYRFADFLKK